MKGRPRSLLMSGLALAWLGCPGSPPARQEASPQIPSETSPTPISDPRAPALTGVEPRAREQLERQRAQVAAVERQGTGEEIGRAHGEMGRLYHAYGLLPAAIAAYQAAQHGEPMEPRWPYLLGIAQQQAGDLGAADGALANAQALAPANGAIALHRGELLLDLNRAPQALSQFKTARAAGAAYELAARFGMGRAQLALGDAQAAAGELQAILAAAPQAGKVRYPLALALRSLGRIPEAQALLAAPGEGELSFPDPWREALRALAQGGGAAMRQGGQDLMAGRFPAAEAAFRQAVEADPGSAEARRNLALALLRQGKAQEAVTVLNAGLAVAADDSGLLFDLGTTLLATGDVDGAIDRFERVLTLVPGYTAARFNLANALIAQGRWNEAFPHLETVVAANPNDGKARYLLAMAHAQRGEAAVAQEQLGQLLAGEPALLPARLALSTLLEQSGDAAAASQLLEQALTTQGKAAEKATVLARLGSLAARRGAAGRAEELFRQAITTDAGSSDGHLGLAELLFASSRFGEAAREFAAAVRALPPTTPAAEAAVPILGHALALSQAGRQAEVAQALEAAASRFPRDGRVQLTLAKFLATCPEARRRDGRRALALAEGVYRSQPSLAAAEVVAMAKAAGGDFAGAAAWQRALLAKLPAANPSGRDPRPRLQAALRLYEQGRAVERPLD